MRERALNKSVRRTARTRLIAGAAAGAVAILACFPALGATPKTRRVSLRSNGAEGDRASSFPSMTREGREVAFQSAATSLVPGDDNHHYDVFVHDWTTAKTERVSVNSDGDEADGGSFDPSISPNGHLVAFQSVATNLVPGDNNGQADVFVHDRRTGETERVSVDSNGDEAEGGDSLEPSISLEPGLPQGRLVAFHSYATNLVPGDNNGKADVFVHNRESGKTKRVSVRSNGAEAHGGSSLDPFVSADTRFVAFSSRATNLVPGDNNGKADVFVHNRKSGKTERVSMRSNGNEAEGGGSRAPSISSHEGKFVAFWSRASNLVPRDNNGKADVFVHNRKSGKTKRVSVRSNGAEAKHGDSFNPSISMNGGFVAFDSKATNLVPGDDNGKRDVFVRGPLR